MTLTLLPPPTIPSYTTTSFRTIAPTPGSGNEVDMAVDAANDRIYIVTKNDAQGGALWAYVCTGDGRGCSGRDISGGQGANSGRNPSAALDAANGRLYVATRNGPASSRPWLFVCNVQTWVCSNHDMSASQTGSSGVTPSLALDVPGGKVMVVANNQAQTQKPWLFVCALNGTLCSDHDLSNTQADGSGRDPSFAFDATRGKVIVATRNDFQDQRPWVFICNPDGSACSDHDISATQGPNSGYFPSLALDQPAATLYVVTRNNDQAQKPWLFVCHISGSPCTDHDISGDQILDSGYFPSLGLDLGAGTLYVVTANEKTQSSFSLWMFACHMGNLSSCTNTDITQGTLTAGKVGSHSLIIPSTGPKGYVVSRDALGDSVSLRILSPFANRTCPDISLPRGNYTYQLSYPDWYARGVCDSGYGLVGSAAVLCTMASGTWASSFPTCVQNVSDVSFALTQPVAVAGDPVLFSMTDQNGPSGTHPGTAFPSVAIDGIDVPLTFSYQDGDFAVTLLDLPTAVGTYALEIYLNSLPLGQAYITITPSVFGGFLRSGIVGSIVDRLSLVVVAMEDRFGNPIGTNDIVTTAPLLGSLVADVTGAVTTTTLIQPIARGGEPGDGTLLSDAGLVFSTPLPGNYTFTAAYGGAPIPGAAQIVSVCGAKLQPVGGVCAPLSCNPGSINVGPVNETVATCVCNEGFTRDPSGRDLFPLCTPCPPGASCPIGLGPPIPLKGFYPTGDGSFVRCKRPDACQGGSVVCAPGYTGYMCNTCQTRYYSNSARACVSCPSRPGGLLAGALVLLVCVAAGLACVVALSVARGTKHVGSGSQGRETTRVRTVPASLSMILTSCQVIGILGAAQFGWSESAQSTLNVFNAANIDVNLFASECALDSFHVKYAVSIALPLAVIALVVIFLCVLKAAGTLGLGQAPMPHLLDATLFGVAPLVYIPMANALLVIFDCTRLPNGTWVLDGDPGVPCFDNAWWSVAWLGILGVSIFVMGVPVYFLLCVVPHQGDLMSPTTYARYGMVYKLYRLPYYWGGVADLGKRLAIVVAAVFVSDHVLAQIGVMLAVILGSALLVVHLKPYFYPLYNSLDLRLMLVLVVVLLLGAASHAERDTAGSSDTVILSGVIIVVLVLVAVGIHAVAVDIIQIVQARRDGYSAHRDRGERLAGYLEREVADLGHHLDPNVAADIAQIVSTLRDTRPHDIEMESTA